MKAAPAKNISAHSNLQTAEKPFFQKKGEGQAGKNTNSFPVFHEAPPIQTKLTIGQPGDKYEQEADQMAEQVVQKLAAPGPPPENTSNSPAIQAKCAECETEEKLQEKEEPTGEGPELQRKAIFESNEESLGIQTKSESERPSVTPNLESHLSSSRGKGSPLSLSVRSHMEGAFGTDFSSVRVHTDSSAVQMNKELGAQAFTHGPHIYFGTGKYDTGSSEGKGLLAHELTHTVQQGASTQHPSIQRQSSKELSEEEKDEKLTTALVEDKKETNQEKQEIFENNPKEEKDVEKDVEKASKGEKEEKSADSRTKEDSGRGNQGSKLRTNESGSKLPPLKADAPPEKAEEPPVAALNVTGEQTLAFEQFLQYIVLRREGLIQLKESKGIELKAYFDEKRLDAESHIQKQRLATLQFFDNTFSEAYEKDQLFLQNLASYEQEKISWLGEQAKTNISNLDDEIRTKKTNLLDLAEEKATEAETIGDREAKRAAKHAEQKIKETNELAETKVQIYSGYNRANRIARVLRQMAADTVKNLLEISGKTSTQVSEDAAELAKKFRTEAREGVKKFEEAREPALKQIEEERTKGVDLVKSTVTSVKNDFQKTSEDFFLNLDHIRTQTLLSLDNTETAVLFFLDQHEKTLLDELEQKFNDLLLELDQFMIYLSMELEGVAESLVKKVVQKATPELEDIFIRFEESVLILDTDTRTLVDEELAKKIDKSALQVDESNSMVGKILQDYLKGIDDIEASYHVNVDPKVDTEIPAAMEGVVKTTGEKLQQSIDESKSNWTKEIQDGEAEIVKKVDDVIATMTQTVEALRPKMNEKAEEIENESFWSRLGKFVGGIVMGLLKGLWDLVVAILIVLLIVLAIVVVILAIAALIGGLAGFLAALAVILEVGVVILEIVAVVGIVFAIVGIGIGIYKIYLGATREDLDDYDRGELIGGGIFDIAESLVDLKVVKFLGKLVRGGKMFDLADDINSFKKIVDVVGDAKRAEKIVDAVGDVRKAEKLINTVGDVNRLEKLLAKTDNIILLEKLLDDIGDAKKLEDLLAKADKVSDVNRMLQKTNNADQLLRFFDAATDAREVEKALDNIGDAKKLDDLLKQPGIRNIEDINELMRYVDNADQLKRLLAKTDDPQQLLRVLQGTDANTVEKLLKGVDKADDVKKILTNQELDTAIKGFRESTGIPKRLSPGGKTTGGGTVGAGRVEVEGAKMPDKTYTYGSKEALPEGEFRPNQRYPSPSDFPGAQNHAEQTILGDIATALDKATGGNKNVSGKVNLRVDQPPCSTCKQGFDPKNPVDPGIIKQFSSEFKNIELRITNSKTGEVLVYKGGVRVE